MDSAIRKLVGRLDEHLGQMSRQMEELHESVRQVVVVAEADPEMALTKARKVLESVLRRVWEHFIPNEPVGTRPLEEVLQRLQKNGHLPRKQAAYAYAVKELGNVGTHVHDEKVDKADVVQALSPLISVLEWYFEQDWAVGAATTTPRDPRAAPTRISSRDDVAPVAGQGTQGDPATRPRHPIRLAAAIVVTSILLIVAGWFVTSRPKAVPPMADPAKPIAKLAVARLPRTDEDRIQGRWQVAEVYLPPGVAAKKKNGTTALDPSKTVWTFRGRRLTISNLADGEATVKNEGTFSLSKGVERKFFDYATTAPKGEPMAFTGIYELDGEFFRVCYGIRLDPANQPPESRRPDSFIATNDPFRRANLKFRRVGE